MPSTPNPPRELFQSLDGPGLLPLEPNDPTYVPILQSTPEKDPIMVLWQELAWSTSESVNLLTGFRGNGKSTELRRLKSLLEADPGAKVFLVDMTDHLLMTKPLELSDFVLSLMTALAGAVERDTGLRALTHSYWERLGNFLGAEVSFDTGVDLKTPGAAVKLGLKLKQEPDFKQRVQQHLRGHLSRLIADARDYVVGLVDAIRADAGDPRLKVVLLVDSVEQIRGSGPDAQQVHDSVVDLFSTQASNLAFPKLHLVYTIPPYLPTLAKNLGRSLGARQTAYWPNVHVRHKNGQDDPEGLGIMQRIIQLRYAGWSDVLPEASLKRLAICSGGDLRDFFRLIRDCATALGIARMRDPEARLTEQMTARAEEQLRNELLPLADDDARWLAKIQASKEPSLPSTRDLPALARFLDSNLIMNYLNGQPWYDIHPLLHEEIQRRLQPVDAQNPAGSDQEPDA